MSSPSLFESLRQLADEWEKLAQEVNGWSADTLLDCAGSLRRVVDAEPEDRRRA